MHIGRNETGGFDLEVSENEGIFMFSAMFLTFIIACLILVAIEGVEQCSEKLPVAPESSAVSPKS